MPFAFLYSRKNKVFTPEEQNKIDKIYATWKGWPDFLGTDTKPRSSKC